MLTTTGLHLVASLSLALASYGLAAPTTTSSAANLVVDLGYAKYQGSVNPATNNTEFLGIRYAAAPTGSLRWKEPQTPAETPGVQLANTIPSICLQGSEALASTTPFRSNKTIHARDVELLAMRDSDGGPSDDCLFLNVYTPGTLGQPKKSLPVIVWIHGGGYAAGSAGSDGNDLVKEAGNGAVAVTIQYRLGIFGFLPGKEVKKGGALNAGLLDQQFALKWVQQHISKFGGDPSKVSIWGESAGAGSVLQHIIANNGNTRPPLFRGAITSSTYLPSQYKFDDPVPETLYSTSVAMSNCSSAADTLDCLRKVDVNVLQAANTAISASGFFGTFVFVPVIDGTFITDRPINLIREGKINGEKLFSVTNTFEGRVFVSAPLATQLGTPAYLSNLFPTFGQEQINTGAAVYANLGTAEDQAVAIMGESIFICPTYFLLRAFNQKSFKGEFALPPGNHGMDVAYYFPSGNPNGIPPFNNTDFDKAFPEAFLNFVISLDPNVKTSPTITPRWNLWNGQVEMLFNMTEAGAPVIHPITTSSSLLQRCNFWESVNAFSAQ